MTHLLLRAPILFLLLTLGARAEMVDLFSLKLRLEPEQVARQIDPILRDAVSVELVRLSGDGRIDPAIMRYFTKRPRRWVLSYRFSPRKEEGVVVGKRLEVVFDRPRLLQALAEQDIVWWPAPLRPVVLVTGSWVVHGTAIPVDERLPATHPDFDPVYVGQLLGLSIRLPVLGDKQANRPVMTDGDVRALAERYGVDGVLRIHVEDLHVEGRRQVRMRWQSRVPGWNDVGNGMISAQSPQQALEKALIQRMAQWRTLYLEGAGTIEHASVVLAAARPEQLLAFEQQLEQAAPVVVSARLVQVSQEQGRYAIRYRGGRWALERMLEVIPGVRMKQVRDDGTLVMEAAL